MNWIWVALSVIASSVVLYLAIRKTKDQGIALELRNLAMFSLPAILMLVYNLIQEVSLTISTTQLLIIVVAGVLFSWIGSMASLKSLELAPNQGYSLIISKSYVVMTAVLSVWIFNSPLTGKDLLAIALIVGFSALIMIDGKNRKTIGENNTWLWLAGASFLAWGFLALTLTYLTSQEMISTVILFYLMSIVTGLITLELLFKKIKLKISKNDWRVLAIVGLASTGFNLSLVVGYKMAPNPGFINAANAGSIALVTLFSAWIFKDELDRRKLAGVLGVLLGLGLLLV